MSRVPHRHLTLMLAAAGIVAVMTSDRLAAQPAAPQPSGSPALPAVAPLPERPAEGKQPSTSPPPAPVTNPAPGEPSTAAADPDMRRVAACKQRALARLKEASPSIDDIFIDVDGLTIAESRSKLGDTEVRGVIMGEAYIQRDHSDRANRFLCLTGADGDVLFTFFTER